ncbi:phosphopantetheine-binding protein [Thermomonospora umbrina]|uniref:Phosphopantetheine binding protein n=1 Tax=Thermomonospora umbrina TaxID=111806 RepID=A0A3D9SMA9_9ACTN|nr:phosphopantetheine-binding protein [Thermomonospora umbrina]REE95063.1 phosphopantetheine binding protein [Thermomonospora umbrina]
MTPVEEELSLIWGELLDLDPAEIPSDASFLRLGGDSVLAVRLSALVRRRMAVDLALSDVTVEITLGRLADLVATRSSGDGAGRALPVELERRPDPSAPFPLMPLQQGYFVGQHDGWELSYDSAHFYGDVALTGVDGDEAAEALEDALHRLALHQPMLRVRITAEGDQYVLPPDAAGAIPRPVVYDLRKAEAEEVSAHLESIRREMSTTGPNPLEGPGLDIRLSLLPEGRGRLHTAMSLLTLDGWSATLLNRELLTLAADWNAVLAPLDVDFGDYVTSLGRLRDSEPYAADRDWWWARLDDAPPPPALPLRADPRDVRPTTMGTREDRLPAGRWAALREQCASHEVTPSAAMMTAFGVVLARWAGHRRMLLNSLQLNRLPLHPDIHRVIGAFATTMLLPVEPAPDRTFADLAGEVQRAFSEHASHNLVSGVEVSRELARRRGTTRPIGPVVFQSTLGMDAAIGERQAESAGPLGELVFDDFHHQLRTPQVALEVRFYEMHDEMAFVFSLVEELFVSSQVDAAFADLRDLIESLAAGPGWDASVDLPSALDPAESATLSLDRLPERTSAPEEGPPADELEQRICDLWEEVLDAPVLDRATPFFALGGDSLLAVRTLARIAKEFGTAPSVREFLDAPTVAGLATALRTRVR